MNAATRDAACELVEKQDERARRQFVFEEIPGRALTSPIERRAWKCGACRKQFSVPTGTIMHEDPRPYMGGRHDR